MQGQDTTISTFHQLFNPISTEKFLQLVKEMGVDKSSIRTTKQSTKR